MDEESFQAELWKHGYVLLVVQHGKSESVTSRVDGLIVQNFDYVSAMEEHMKNADLIISHAGAGSIFEALRAKKKLVVVANDTLMDNHQKELAEELADRNLIVHADPVHLLESLQRVHTVSLRPYKAGNASEIAREIDACMGWDNVT